MTESSVQSICVQDLFGLYTYQLPQSGSFRDAAILYGDNGVGKSTILRLAFHLLSPAEKRSHRTSLTKVPFRRLEVLLGSGVSVSAHREGELDSSDIALTVSQAGKILAEWIYDSEDSAGIRSHEMSKLPTDFLGNPSKYSIRKLPNGQLIVETRELDLLGSDSYPRGEAAFISELKRVAPTVFLLNAERKLDSDAVPDPSDEVELRRMLRYEDPKRINDLVVRSREIALSQALGAAAKWIGKQAVQGANRGSTNVHGVYVNVLRHLGGANATRKSEVQADPEKLLSRLAALEARSLQYAKYEFTPALPTGDFQKALASRARQKRELSANLLQPYVTSLEQRLAALDNIYQFVDLFVTTVNDFLSDKSLAFKLSLGFRITSRLGVELEPRQLSSGEQQLLLLFCYVLTARELPSLFIIDEPEISLNIKWQRKLVKSLLDITKGAQTQFILASHSMELIAQHRNRVVQLVSERDE